MTETSDYLQVVDLLRAESEAIAKAASRLRAEEVDRVVAILTRCKGKIVLLGVGKSGIIAHKIAATMTSSGTAAVYLHPSDALHGGLGIVNPDDVVLMLSNSGETAELQELLPFLKRRGVPIVAILGNVKSSIAQRADAVIDASVDQEACPLNRLRELALIASGVFSSCPARANVSLRVCSDERSKVISSSNTPRPSKRPGSSRTGKLCTRSQRTAASANARSVKLCCSG